uniref:(northern house mosquito) hypothetical protein n=1 Tax=Culex pipiens TaxID=7175 RepID=A0A8D8CJQ4_CULPI
MLTILSSRSTSSSQRIGKLNPATRRRAALPLADSLSSSRFLYGLIRDSHWKRLGNLVLQIIQKSLKFLFKLELFISMLRSSFCVGFSVKHFLDRLFRPERPLAHSVATLLYRSRHLGRQLDLVHSVAVSEGLNEAVREDVVATHGKLCFAESVGSVVVVPIEGFVGEDRRHKLYERH